MRLQLLHLSRRLSTHHHLHQLLSRAVVSGLVHQLPVCNSLLHTLPPSLSLALLRLLLRRHGRLAPDSYTLTSALRSAARLSLPQTSHQLHALAIKIGLHADTFVINSLINAYSATSLAAAATAVFRLAPPAALDVVSWNTIISGYLRANLCEESLRVFGKMLAESPLSIDADTPVSPLIACGRIGALDLGRRIHGFVVGTGFNINVYLGSSLITMYAKCGAVGDARKVFDHMTDKNAICWTSMITGYAHSGLFRESVGLFREMQAADESVMPDDATMASVISSCAQLGALDQGRYIHAYCDANGTATSLPVRNALIDMYSKCGDVNRALQIFRGLARPDVFSWTAMISGLAINGNSDEALDLFSQMEVSGGEVMPNEVTFLGVLLACSHGGIVDKGYRHFYRMSNVYNLSPRIEHYGCMVDLLGRAKLLAESVRFISEMPVEPDVVIWRSLLFACRAQGDVKLAEYTAQRIIELEPTECVGRVLLSNVYAVASRWSDVNKVRRFMNDSRIQKQPGCSFIEVNGAVHEFTVADRLHEQIGVIHGVLWGINRLLHSETYSTYNLGLCDARQGGRDVILL